MRAWRSAGERSALPGIGRAVADRPHERGIVEVAVAVDHEAGIAGQQRRRVQLQRHVAGDVGGADVPADVARQLALVEAEVVQAARHAPAGVIADQQDGRRALRIEDLVGRRFVLGQQRCGGRHCSG